MVGPNSPNPDSMQAERPDSERGNRSTRTLTPRRTLNASDYDLQTGLINRKAFLDRLTDAVRYHRSHRGSFALLLLRMDDLESISERYGNGIAEQVIGKYAEQLRTGVRSTDTVARIGEDQFAVILEGIMEPSKAQGVADRLAKRLAKPIMAKGALLQVLSDMGYALYPQEGIEAKAIFERADQATQDSRGNRTPNTQMRPARRLTSVA
ncbi:GGDEF domain-containing protein [Thiorhodococcus fuscus]|uniref:GGDEF domain-containing protein n=1 Tax=Thiorhodococcus fuscus TaxID=527200 RepID=A0ABW4YA93_9GAMM